MNRNLYKDNRGVAQIALIAIAVVVIAGIGFAAYRMTNKDKSSDNAATSVEQKAAQEACAKNNDKDLCKFLTSWKANEKYSMTTTDPDGNKSTFKVDGNKSHVSMTMQGAAYEVITIDKTSYTKAGNVWYKQTVKETDQNIAQDYKVDFEEPETDTDKPAEDKTTYNKLGKEACGDRQCFKYEVVNPDAAAGSKEFIWFDDKDFQLRRTRSETKEGATEMVFEYGNVSVSEPSPVKNLAPNQMIIPGQTEPMTIPGM